jgi:endoglucanase
MQRREFLRGVGAAGVVLQSGRLSFAASPGQQAAQDSTPSILLNSLGFRPGETKQATVRLGATPGAASFQVVPAAGGAALFTGTLGPPLQDAASGDSTALVDFSSLRAPGRYRLQVNDLHSDPFPIGEPVYAYALRLTMRAFYGQRCGCAVDLGGGYTHALCHADGAFHPTSGKSGKLPNHGGWHDAGDYGRYIVNAAISTGTLLWAWEMFPAQLHALGLGIPESGGKLPDYLAEVRWNLNWMLQLQDADGGVWHKQTSEHFCGFVMPAADTLVSYVIGTGSAPYKSTGATAGLATVMAIAARCYAPYDAAFAHRCLTAARSAYTWAAAHPTVVFQNSPGITTGGYGDNHLNDDLAWAAAELWRTTGEPAFEHALLAALPAAPAPVAITGPSWSDVMSMALWTYAMASRPGDAAAKARIQEATLQAADTLVQRRKASGYGNTLALPEYGWGSNSVACNQSLLLLVAGRMGADNSARAAALGNLDYLLGRNCFGVSWVTQLGARPFLHPHHRPSIADHIVDPWPGLLSGGPNAHGGDAIADKMPKAPPMRMWLDNDQAYSLNEVAINWNAPLVFLLAGANS